MFTATRLQGAFALALGLGCTALAQQGTAEKRIPPAEVRAVLKLADNLDRPDVAREAKSVGERYGSCGDNISRVFNLKDKGGVGIGSAVTAGHKDSIEDLVQNWSGPRPPSKHELQAHQKDLRQVARVVQAMAELAPYRVDHLAPGTENFPEEFQKVAAEFQATARAFRQALEAGEPAEVRKAAVNLHRSCNACHKGFNFR